MQVQYAPVTYMKLTEHEAKTVNYILDHTSGFFAKVLNKRFSIPCSIYLARVGIAPNFVTFINLLLGIYAAYLAMLGSHASLAWGGFLFQMVSIIDGVDGEIAKLNNKSSKFGAWFDTFGDNVSLILFLTGVAIGTYRLDHSGSVLVASTIALMDVCIIIFIMGAYLLKTKSESGSLTVYEKEVIGKFFPAQSFRGKLLNILKYFVKKDCFALGFFLLSITPYPQSIIFAVAGIASIEVAILLYITVCQIRYGVKGGV